MTASRTAAHTDTRRVVTVFVGLGAQPADRSLAVLNLLGVRVEAFEPIINARRGVPFGGQTKEHRIELRLAALGPATTVNPHEQRRLGRCVFRDEQIEQQ